MLHDVTEDCDVPDDFLVERFAAAVCKPAGTLTRQDSEDYPRGAFSASTLGTRLIEEADIADKYGRIHLLSDQRTRERCQSKY